MMKTKILAFVTGSMLVSGIGFAAPISDVTSGQTTVGYSHYSLSHSTDNDSFYLQNAISDKFTLGIEYNSNSAHSSDWSTTDVYARYKIVPKVSLILGNRNYDYAGSDNKVFYGVGVHTNLAPKLDGYASVITNSTTTEWQTGVNYGLSDTVGFNVDYKSNKDKDHPTYDGVGVGVNYKF